MNISGGDGKTFKTKLKQYIIKGPIKRKLLLETGGYENNDVICKSAREREGVLS